MGIFTVTTNEFIKTFFSFPSPRSCSSKPPLMSNDIMNDIRKAAATRNNQRRIAELWEQWMKRSGHHSPCPDFQLATSQDKWDPTDTKRLKVDAALYATKLVPKDGRPHWEIQEALWEFKPGVSDHNPYDDIKQDVANADVCGQMSEYVAHAFSIQHRTVLFFFLINGTRARVSRWDRSGTISTESFDYTEDRVTLRDILWGLSLLTPSARGSDDTAVPLSPTSPDYRKMTKEAQECATDISEAEGTVVESQGPHTFKHVRDLFAASIADGAPRYRIYVPTSSGGTRAYLVGKPIIAAPGMSGRGTRGFVAWDKTTERFVFLKDAWRPFYENIETEGAVLRKLAAAKVRNVPTYVCDAELDHYTSTPSLAKKTTKRKPAEEPSSASNGDPARPQTPQRRTSKRTRNGELIPSLTPSQNAFVNRGKHFTVRYFRHYRLVVEEVCMSLSVFKNGKQLFSVVRDCVQAHEDAVNKAHVHHWDISAGNMLICPTIVKCEDGKQRVTWRGVLIDWELSKPITPDDTQLAAQQPKRIGTWQFTCARLLDDPSAAVMTADELESFFWVILYNALRYLRHTCLNVTSAMFDLFDDYDYEDTLAECQCGPGRRSAISTARLPKVCGEKYKFLDDNLEDHHPANNFVRTVLRWLRARYALLEGESQSDDDSDDDIKVDPHKRAANAQKLENHKALLNLFDDLLQREWSTDDKCGDLLKDPSKAHVPQVPLNNPLVSLAIARLKEDADDNGKPESKRVRKRAKTRRRHCCARGSRGVGATSG